jgi:hypothetical protein
VLMLVAICLVDLVKIIGTRVILFGGFYKVETCGLYSDIDI